jgi:hypothetical protein
MFSDLNWGPKTGWEGSTTKGAAITIWGKNFGGSRGSNYVTVNGTQLTANTDYAEWGAVGPARGLERITFWLNSSAQDGPGNITVTINGLASNPIPFTVANGTIYFVSTTGNNSNNGLYSTTQGGTNGPFKDIWKFNPCGSNDSAHTVGSCNPSQDGQYIVYVRGGTYTTFDPSGEGTFVALRGPYGGPTKQKALVGYPAETPVLNMAGNQRGAVWQANYLPYGQNSYFTFAKLTMTGGTGDGLESFGSYDRIIGNTLQNIRPSAQFQSGTIFVGAGTNTSIYGNLEDNTGNDSFGHQIYVKTQIDDAAATWDITASNVYIGWNEFSSPYASDVHGGAIFLSTQSGVPSTKFTNHVYIHDNYFHDGSESDFVYADDGQRIDSVWVWNNILTGGTGSDSAMFFTFGDLRNFYIYNNTFYNTSSPQGMISFNNDPHRTNFRLANNIFVPKSGQPYMEVDSTNQSVTAISSTNDLFFGGSSLPTLGGGVINSVTGDPKFTNAAGRDFSLQAGSAAIGKGMSSLIQDANSDIPIGTRDYNGKSRTSTYDIGAFAY